MMRKQALRASSTQNVCVFCASRLGGGDALALSSAPATRYAQRRRGIHSSRVVLDAEKQALLAKFKPKAEPPASPPQSSAPPRSLKISFHMQRGSGSGEGSARTPRNERRAQYRSRLESAQHHHQPQQDADFDPSKVSQWKHLRSKSQPSQRSQDRNNGLQEGQGRQRHAGSRSFVPLRSEEQRREEQDRLMKRFNIQKPDETAKSDATSNGPQTAQSQDFSRPATTSTQSSGGDAENQALRAQFSGLSSLRSPLSFNPQPTTTGTQSTGRDTENEALRAQFRTLDSSPTQFSFKSQPRPEPSQNAERDALRDRFSGTPEDHKATVVEETGKSQESQSGEMEQREAAVEQVRQRERANRFSKFAAAEEDDGPRKRKVKGGRNKASGYKEDEFNTSRVERKSKKDKKKQRAMEVAPPTPIYLPEYLSVVNLANLLRVRTEDLVRKMEELGFEDVMNDDILNAENAGLIAMEYNFEPVAADPADDLDLYPAPEPEDKTILPTRPPVVTIMGHVDHGKTTLLDFLRKSSVAATEFGGITQHIGAFSVPLSAGKTITFLDTPGHAAFLNMRQRGANVTDIVILVVAADDSVKPQTIEAIKHAKAARVPIIVAINKIDKEGANPERVKQDLSRHGVDVEDFGGDVQAIPVSGKTGQGMKDLEEAAITLSEILDHRANTDGPVEGWILEATTKKSGKVATILVRRGTLKVGSIVVAGKTFARVRSIRNEAGANISSVGPGMPAEIDGWRGQPEAGDEVLEAPDEQRATEVVEYREANAERVQMAKDVEAINEARRLEHEKREREEALAAAAEAGEADPEAAVAAAEAAEKEASGVVEVPFIVKADVSGSVEAVVDYVMTVGNSEVRPRVIRSGVGGVSEFDIEYAATAGGHIVSFNVALDSRLARMAESKGVRVLEQNVIYRLVDDVKGVLSERLEPLVVQRVSGEASVLQVFSIALGKKQTMAIAGCRVTNGTVQRGSKVRVLRGEEKVYEGTISSLKQVKKDVTEMRKGSECGMAFEEWGDAQPGDSIQCYEERFEKRYL